MKIKLTDNPTPSPFAFKTGDKVRSRIGTMGVIIAGDRYPDLDNQIFYLVKLASGLTFSYAQSELQLLQEGPAKGQAKTAEDSTSS